MKRTSRNNSKKRGRKKGVRIAVILTICAAGVIAAAAFFFADFFAYNNPLAERGLPYRMAQNGSIPEDVTVNGKTYRYNKNVVSVLFIGYDKTDQREKQGIGYQADTLILLAVNMATGKTDALAIPRDTLAEIPVTDINGAYVKTDNMQIALANAYGREDAVGFDFTMAAVSNLLYRVPVVRFVAMDVDAIGPLTDAAGGIELEILEDFSMFNPQMLAGATYNLTGDDAELYVRSRQIPGMSGLNTDRMTRQAQFVAAFEQKVKQLVKEDPSALQPLAETVGQYVTTNLTKKELTLLLWRLLSASADERSIVMIPGQTEQVKDVYEPVYVVNEKELRQLVLDIFFTEV